MLNQVQHDGKMLNQVQHDGKILNQVQHDGKMPDQVRHDGYISSYFSSQLFCQVVREVMMYDLRLAILGCWSM